MIDPRHRRRADASPRSAAPPSGRCRAPRFAMATALNSVARQVGRGARRGGADRDPRHPLARSRRCTPSSTAGCSPAPASWRARSRASALVVRRRSEARPSSRGRRVGAQAARRGAVARGARRAPELPRARRGRRRARAAWSRRRRSEFLRSIDGLLRALAGRCSRRSRRSPRTTSLAPRRVAVPGGRASGRASTSCASATSRSCARSGQAGPQRINTLTRGAVLGELALLSDSVRSASVRALRDSELLRIDRASFESLLRSEPELALGLDPRR